MSNNIKLIAVDLDGTFLQTNHELSNYTKNLWIKLKQQGIHLLPVTGRTLQGMCFSLPYEMCEYTINTNGVHIFLNQHNISNKIWDKSMPWEHASKVLEFIHTHYPKIQTQAYVGENLFSTSENERTQEYTRRSGISYTVIKSWNELKGKSIPKIMLLHDHEELELVQERLNSIEHVHAMFSMPMYLEIFSNQASKGHALEHVMQLLHIKKSEVLGIGDSYNDIPMLDVCGTSYIMKNAKDRVAPHYKRTTYTNDEDGAAKLIEQLLGF